MGNTIFVYQEAKEIRKSLEVFNQIDEGDWD